MAPKKPKRLGKAYVIIWISYDYNDQFYYPSGDMLDAIGTPNAVYMCKASAEQACKEENAKTFAGLDLEEYVDGDISALFKDKSITEEEHVTEIFKELFNKEATSGHFIVPKEAPLKNLMALADMVDLKFYTVVETGIYEAPRETKSHKTK